jgi:hypothetical protein
MRFRGDRALLSLLTFITYFHYVLSLRTFITYFHCLLSLLTFIAYFHCLLSLLTFIAYFHCLLSLLTFIAYFHCLLSLMAQKKYKNQIMFITWNVPYDAKKKSAPKWSIAMTCRSPQSRYSGKNSQHYCCPCSYVRRCNRFH